MDFRSQSVALLSADNPHQLQRLAIDDNLEAPACAEMIDAGGRYVMPGGRTLGNLTCPQCGHVDTYAPALMSRDPGPETGGKAG
jgi:hypothetical protein